MAVLARRVALGAGFTSDQIDRGEINEADAMLLLQPVEAVQSWAAAAAPTDRSDEFEPYVKRGIVKIVEGK